MFSKSEILLSLFIHSFLYLVFLHFVVTVSFDLWSYHSIQYSSYVTVVLLHFGLIGIMRTLCTKVSQKTTLMLHINSTLINQF